MNSAPTTRANVSNAANKSTPTAPAAEPADQNTTAAMILATKGPAGYNNGGRKQQTRREELEELIGHYQEALKTVRWRALAADALPKLQAQLSAL